MKHFFTYFLTAALAIMPLTSCEAEDEQLARTLEGDWSGTMEDYYYNRWGDMLPGGNYHTYFRFQRQSPTSGYGTEIDEDGYGNYVERDFTWRVEYQYSRRYDYYDDGFFTIYLNYDSRYYYEDRYGHGREVRSDIYQAVIYDAYLSDNYFEGEMEDSDGSRKHFRLTYQSNNNWRWRTSTRSSVKSGNNEK